MYRQPTNAVDITGERFGMLTALYRHPTEKHNGAYKWVFRCDCGKEIVAVKGTVVSGYKKSCGCMTSAWKSAAHTTHGYGHRGIAGIWGKMKWRCYNPNCPQYPNYGGRGIVVCDEWKDNCAAFIEWALANGYEKGLTIERIDVNGNYEPNNCTWIPNEEQWKNRREKKSKHFGGERVSLKAVCAEKGLDYSVIKERLTMGWDIDKALSEPVKKYNVLRDAAGNRIVLAAVARKHGVDESSLRKRVRRGQSLEQAVQELLDAKRSSARR